MKSAQQGSWDLYNEMKLQAAFFGFRFELSGLHIGDRGFPGKPNGSDGVFERFGVLVEIVCAGRGDVGVEIEGS